MIFIVIALCIIGAWEVYVYKLHRYAEDALISFASFSAAMFLTFLSINDATFWG